MCLVNLFLTLDLDKHPNLQQKTISYINKSFSNPDPFTSYSPNLNLSWRKNKAADFDMAAVSPVTLAFSHPHIQISDKCQKLEMH